MFVKTARAQACASSPNGSVNVDGDIPIRDLNRAMNWDLPDDEAVTMTGLVNHEAQRNQNHRAADGAGRGGTG